MKHHIAAALTGAALFAAAPAAHAASFTVDFCPTAASCPAGVSEASLTFEEVLTGNDINDYILTMTITGDATSPKYIDEVSFDIAGVSVPGGYEALPVLTSSPAVGATWDVAYDGIPGCTQAPLTNTTVCAQSAGNGALTNGTNTWVWSLDLTGDTFYLKKGIEVNFRAQFLKEQITGPSTNPTIRILSGGILSPDFEPLDCVSANNCRPQPEDPSVPEPATLALLGLGLLGAGVARRRKQ